MKPPLSHNIGMLSKSIPLLVLFLASCVAQEPEPDLESSGVYKGATNEISGCASVKADALAAAKTHVGYMADSTLKLIRDTCKANDMDACNNLCTYCKDDSTCWPKVDVDNPCIATQVMVATAAAEVATKTGELASAAVSAYIATCESYTTKDKCTGGVMSLSVPGCEWCSTNSKCYIMGDLKHNTCLQEHMKNMAKEQANKALDAGKAAVTAQVAAIMDGCSQHSGNDPSHLMNCSSKVECVWCDKVGDTTYNRCYFMGDVENVCLRAEVQATIDAVSGAAKAVSEWAGNAWNDISQFSSSICGKHTTSGDCGNAGECDWCDKDNQCYIVASALNPCGWAQSAISEGKKFFENQFSNKKPCDMQAAYDKLKEVAGKAASNADLACTEFIKSDFYAKRSFSALASDMTAAGESLQSMASVKVQQAQLHYDAALEAVNNTNANQDALKAMEANNECLTSGASAMIPGAFFLSVLALLSKAVTASF